MHCDAPLHPPLASTTATAQYKAPHELVEYSSTTFDTTLDDEDRLSGAPFAKDPMPPDQQRARDVATAVAGIMRTAPKGNPRTLPMLVRQHIEGLGLTLPRLHRLNRFARSNAVSAYRLVGQDGIPVDEWRIASRMVHRAALSILLDVPAQNSHDAYQLAGLVTDALDPPPKAQRRRVAKRLARYFAAMLDGKHFLDPRPVWVWAFPDDSMAPAFPAGTKALYERHKGELVAAGYYIFHGCGGTQIVRRYLHTTPTGRLAVEIFKDATGKPHRTYLDPALWRPYYRIVRHW